MTNLLKRKGRLFVFIPILVLAFTLGFSGLCFAGETETTPWDGTINTSWYNSTDKSFTIDTAAKLAGLAVIVNGTGYWNANHEYSAAEAEGYMAVTVDTFVGKTINLTADLDLGAVNTDGTWGGQAWTPIGGTTEFQGTLDGHGKTIAKVYISGDGNLGLFARIGLYGAVKNLTIASGFVNTTTSITNTGGICGDNKGLIANCMNAADVTGYTNCAGIAGQHTGAIINCANTGKITATQMRAGGIAGYVSGGGNISNVYNTGDIHVARTSSSGFAGGIVGSFYGTSALVTNGYNTGSVTTAGSTRISGTLNRDGGSYNNLYFLKTDTINTTVNGESSNLSEGATGPANKTEAEMKAADFVATLGGAFAADTENVNNGFPFLTSLQAGSITLESADLSVASISAEDGIPSGTIQITLNKTLAYTILATENFNITVTVDGHTTALDTLSASQTAENGVTVVTVTHTAIEKTAATQEVAFSVAINGCEAKTASYTLPLSNLWSAYPAAGFESGEGSADSPYIIKTPEQLAYLTSQVKGGNTYENRYFSLGNDIDLGATAVEGVWSGREWFPIGNANTKFAGTFDGKGYSIKGLYINAVTANQGLFSYVGSQGTVKNVTVDGSISGSTTIAGIAANCEGMIENCVNNAVIQATTDDYAAGIAACLIGAITIKDCTNNAAITVTAGEYAGGIAAQSDGAITVENCLNQGTITSAGKYGAGIIGHTNKSNIQNCTNSGTVTGTTQTAGIVASGQACTVEDCRNTGAITGTSATTAGILASTNLITVDDITTYPTIRRCCNSGAISGGNYSSGIVGSSGASSYNVMNITITDCYNTGAITGSQSAAGILSKNAGNATSVETIANCYNAGSVTGTTNCGAILGAGKAPAVTNCYYITGSVTASSETVQGTSKSAEEMKATGFHAVLNGTAGTSFAADLTGEAALNNGYPVLSWQITAIDQAAAKVVGDAINALPATDNLTLEDKNAVEAARLAYEALTADQKAYVVADDLTKLANAEDKIDDLEKIAADQAAAKVVSDAIDALPATNNLTLEDKNAVEAARLAYEALTADQKAYVVADDLTKLANAEDKIDDLEKIATDQAAAKVVSDTIDALPTVENLTLADKNAVEAARLAYEALTADQKAYVDAADLAKLVADEAMLVELAIKDITALQLPEGFTTSYTIENGVIAPTMPTYLVGMVGEDTVEIPVTYECASFNQTIAGDYVFTGNIGDIPEGYRLVSGLAAPNITVSVKPAAPDVNFDDVPDGAWYADYVYDLVAKGIINGKSATAFAPNDDITRAEFAKILAAASGEDLSSYGGNSTFGDVKAGAWYVTYINWAYAKGIVNGKSATAFAPNDNITRQELAVMIGRYAASYNITLPETETPITFADAASIADWARDAVSAMQKAGIINGKPGNRFDPNGNAERCEAAKMTSIFLAL